MATMTLNQAWHIARQCGEQDFSDSELSRALTALIKHNAPYWLRRVIESRLNATPPSWC